MEQKGLNDMIKKGTMSKEESQKKLEAIDKMINANKNIEVTKSKLPILVIVLTIVVLILIILVNVLDNKVEKKQNNINITEIR